MKKIIITELEGVIDKYDTGRHSEILYNVSDEVVETEAEVADYPVTVFITEGGYAKKIRTANLRMSGEQKLKEGDRIIESVECSNRDEILAFTNAHQVYKAKVDDFQDTKASVLGEYVPSKLDMEEKEEVSYIAVFSEYKGYMIFVFENGKIAKVDMSAYETKTNRKKLINAYSDKSPLAAALYLPEDTDIVICASNGRKLLVNTASILPKTTKNTQGVQAMTLRSEERRVGKECT